MSDSCKPASYDLKVACLRRFQRPQRIGTSVPPFLLRVHREEVGGGGGGNLRPTKIRTLSHSRDGTRGRVPDTRGMKRFEFFRVPIPDFSHYSIFQT